MTLWATLAPMVMAIAGVVASRRHVIDRRAIRRLSSPAYGSPAGRSRSREVHWFRSTKRCSRRLGSRRLRRGSTENGLAALAVLVSVGLQSGIALDATCRLLGEHLDEPLGGALRQAVLQHRRGRALGDALRSELGALGAEHAQLSALLASHAGDGASISPALLEFAAGSRASEARAIEANARRLPVRLLIPLSVCVLPAFVFITVAPVIIESFATLIASP